MNVVRVVAWCVTTDGGMWVGLVSDLAAAKPFASDRPYVGG
jgi:hypothetical protein